MRIEDVGWWVFGISVVFTCLLGIGTQINPGHSEVVAKFKIGDCYHHTGPLKRWEPRAAGMIFDMDRDTYLVVSYLGMRIRPVDRWVYAHERSIELFDRDNVKVECLEEWK